MSPGLAWRRRGVAVAVLVAALIAGYYLWLRDSSLVAVEEVRVEGVTANREEVTAALEQVASEMTTLHIEDEKLREVVSRFPTVASIAADSTLLHSLTITVTERLPVATVKSDGERIAVSADGYLLRGVSVAGERLPPIEAKAEGIRVDADGAAQAAILGGAPAELRERVTAVEWDLDRGGVIVEIDQAPELRFGDGDRAEDKWEAAIAVLTGPEPGSPAYVDVSEPERSVSGG